MTNIKSNYRTYCTTCHYTIWQNERIEYDGKPHHLDCVKALTDDTPRLLHPSYIQMIGKAKKTKIALAMGEQNKSKRVGVMPLTGMRTPAEP